MFLQQEQIKEVKEIIEEPQQEQIEEETKDVIEEEKEEVKTEENILNSKELLKDILKEG